MGPNINPSNLKSLRVTAANAAQTCSLPIGAVIAMILYQETAGNAVTGGVSIGTTLAGTDVVAAQAVGSSAFTFTPAASVLKSCFSMAATQTLYIGAVGSWNSANVIVTIYYYDNSAAA